MSRDAAPLLSVPAAEPRSGTASRNARLLAVVRGLIALGTAILGAVQRNDTRPTAMFEVFNRFGTRQVGLFVARLRRGLALAAALEQRVLGVAARMDAVRPEPVERPLDEVRRERPVRRARKKSPVDTDDTALLTGLPSADVIAAMARDGRIGEVLEAICRDIGVTSGDEIWLALVHEIDAHGGSWMRLWKAQSDRSFVVGAPTQAEMDDMEAGGVVQPLLGYGTFRQRPDRQVGTGPPEFALAA